MTIKEYQQINKSFDKVCIYRIGNEGGLFSELNNMIIALIFCLEKKLQFKLYSANANFGNDIWKDYFKLFTVHSDSVADYLFNERPYIHKKPYKLTIEQLFAFKQLLSTVFLTQDIWPYIRDKRTYNKDFLLNSEHLNGKLTAVTEKVIK